MTDEAKKVVDALRCDGYCGRKCDVCEYKANGCCYGRLLENDAADLIEKQSAEIEELNNRIADAMCAAIYNGQQAVDRVEKLRNEIESLKNQVYNLTLYLRNAIKNLDSLDKIINCNGENRFTIAFNKDYDGMPGYNPAILEVRDE